MSREFNLVLLGAGVLAAGSILLSDPDPADASTGGGSGGGATSGQSTRGYRGAPMFFYVGATRPVPVSPVAAGGTVRGGFGRVGGAFSGG